MFSSSSECGVVCWGRPKLLQVVHDLESGYGDPLRSKARCWSLHASVLLVLCLVFVLRITCYIAALQYACMNWPTVLGFSVSHTAARLCLLVEVFADAARVFSEAAGQHARGR